MGNIYNLNDRVKSKEADERVEIKFAGFVSGLYEQQLDDETDKTEYINQMIKLLSYEKRVFVQDYIRKNPSLSAKYKVELFDSAKSAN